MVNNTRLAPRRRAARLLVAAAVAGVVIAGPALSGGKKKDKRLQRILAWTEQADGVINVRRYGARGDGIADDTQAFRDAFDAAVTREEERGVGNTVWVPRGVYKSSEPLILEEVRGFKFEGAGVGATELLWAPRQHPGTVIDGQSGAALLELRDVREGIFQNFSIRVGNDFPLPVAIECKPVGSEHVHSSFNVFRDILISGGEQGVERGLRFARGTETDEYNNGHVVQRVTVEDYIDAAFSLEHREAGNIRFDDCLFFGKMRGLSGLATNREICVDNPSLRNCAGAFRWYGGGGGGNRRADFDLGDAEDVILISGAEFEDSARFLHTEGPSGAPWPIVIEGCQWRDDMLGEYPESEWPANEDMRIINYGFKGPLMVNGNMFGHVVLPTGDTKPSEIVWNPGGNDGQFHFTGNYWATSKDNPFWGFNSVGGTNGFYPTLQQDNLVQRAWNGNPYEKREMPQHVTNLPWNQSTPSVRWLSTSREVFNAGDGPAITEFRHGVVGQTIRVFATGEREIVHGDFITLLGSESFLMEPGESLTLTMFTEGVWTETGRCER